VFIIQLTVTVGPCSRARPISAK